MKKILFVLSLLLAFCNCILFAQKTWIGAGAGGAGTDFNTASNWSPSGVPIATDNVTIAITSTATITLSANASIKNLVYSISGNNNVATLDVGVYKLTINGTSSIEALSGNINTLAEIGVSGLVNSGIVDFKGDVSFGTTNLSKPSPAFIGNSNSKVIFRGNLTMGPEAFVESNAPGTVEFDGTGTQTLTWNDINWPCEFNNVKVGNTNNPTVVQATGTSNPDNILGNLTINGSSVLNLGTSRWNRNSAGGTLNMNSTSILKLGNSTGGQSGSNFPANFSTLSINSASTVEYTGTSAQTIYDIASPGYGNLTLTNNSTKTAGGSLDVRGNLLINSPATLAAGSGFAHNVAGNWSNSGAYTASTSTVTFNGSSQQSIQGTSTTTFYNLVFNNTANNAGGDIILNNIDAAVNNSCTFTDGIVNSVTSNMLIFNDNATASGASNASFVNVKVRKIGNDAFTFPIGKSNVGYMRCGISAPSLTTDAFTAEYRRNSATALGPITAVGLYRVSSCEYWILDRTIGTSNVNVTLSWSGISPCSAGAYVTLLSSLAVVHFNGTSWNAYGNNGTTGTGVAGTVTWNTVSTFSPFTLGSTSAAANPLPVKFSVVKAFRINTGNRIEWTNQTEETLKQYEVERSGDGISFSTIDTISPTANDGGEQHYSVTDEHILAQTNFYRIKAVQLDGQVIYSAIVNVKTLANEKGKLLVYPNPVVTSQFTLQLNNYKKGSYILRMMNNNGQQVLNRSFFNPGGSASISIDLPVSLQSGLYYLQMTGNSTTLETKLIIR